MGKLSYEAGKFVFTGNLRKALSKAENWERANVHWEVAGKDSYVTINYEAAALLRDLGDKRALRVLDRAFVKHYPAPSAPLPSFLDPHQNDGVRWILTRSRSYLAHAPGAGKTVQAITAAVLTKGQGQVLFIVPPSLTANWEREARHWLDQLMVEDEWPSIAVLPETADQEFMGWRAEYLIVPDSMLTKDWVLSRLVKIRKRLVAVDEASRFKEPSSQRTIALFGGKLKGGRSSPGLVYDARHAVLLDGSPMPNRPMELWAPTYAMSPESIGFMSQQDFGFRYCGATVNKFGQYQFKHSSREAELRTRLQKSFMHVVPEEALGHPERKRSMLFMNEDVRTLEQKRWDRANLSKLKLSEITEYDEPGELAEWRRKLGLRKVKWVANYVADRLENKNEPILLFAWHRDVCFELVKALRRYRPGLVLGGTNAFTRERYFEEFQRGERNLIIGNIGAMGRGHNLQKAKRAVFAEWSWTDELNKQCEKRGSRRGNDDEFFRCDYVVCPGSLDEIQLNAVFNKASRVKKIIG